MVFVMSHSDSQLHHLLRQYIAEMSKVVVLIDRQTRGRCHCRSSPLTKIYRWNWFWWAESHINDIMITRTTSDLRKRQLWSLMHHDCSILIFQRTMPMTVGNSCWLQNVLGALHGNALTYGVFGFWLAVGRESLVHPSDRCWRIFPLIITIPIWITVYPHRDG